MPFSRSTHPRWSAAAALLAAAVASLHAQPQRQKAVLDQYCVTCHNDKLRTGGLSLQNVDLHDIPPGAETWEKVIRKLRVGAMPPQGMPRPEGAALDGLAAYLETALDRAYAASPNPGRAGMHRLNRAEYEHAIRDLLDLEIDATALLLGSFFLLKAFGAVVDAILRTHWGRLFSITDDMSIVWTYLFRLDEIQRRSGGFDQIPPWSAWAALLAVCGLSLWILVSRLKAREVERA